MTPEPQGLAPSGLMTFEDGVKIALYQSPHLKKSSLEIELRKLDESDSRYGMFPSIDFRTIYYVNLPPGVTSTPYSLNFSTDPYYNPIASYFSLQAQKLATRAAILTHVKAISAGLERLGQLFLELDCVKNQVLNQKDMLNLAREKLRYAENRSSAGTGTSLEVKEAQQGLKIMQNELDRLTYAQKRTMAVLKDFLGLKPDQELTPDLHDPRRQVLGSFEPAAVTWEQAKTRSYDLKIMEILIKLQEYNISLAKIKSFPTLMFTTQTPDPMSQNTRYGYYAGFGLYVPVWDGFKRIRNITRQKTIMKQYNNDKGQTENDLEKRFQDAQEKVRETAMNLQLTQSHLELIQLRSRYQEISYQSGGITLPQLLDSRNEMATIKNKVLQKALEHDEAILALRQISGDLGYRYVDPSSFQK